MLSEAEQRRLAEIESQLRRDRRFAARLKYGPLQMRLVIAAAIALLGFVLTVVSLAASNVAATVASVCLVGAAGFIWTWKKASPTGGGS